MIAYRDIGDILPYFVRGSIAVRLVSSLTGLDSVIGTRKSVVLLV